MRSRFHSWYARQTERSLLVRVLLVLASTSVAMIVVVVVFITFLLGYIGRLQHRIDTLARQNQQALDNASLSACRTALSAEAETQQLLATKELLYGNAKTLRGLADLARDQFGGEQIADELDAAADSQEAQGDQAGKAAEIRDETLALCPDPRVPDPPIPTTTLPGGS